MYIVVYIVYDEKYSTSIGKITKGTERGDRR